MSRIGKKAIPVPSGVKVEVKDHQVKVSGPKGNLEWEFPGPLAVEYDGPAQLIRVTRSSDVKEHRALHGLARALIANMVQGVTVGFEKRLELYGAGYSCNVQARRLHLNIGYMGRGQNRPAQFVVEIPEGVEVKVEAPAARGDTEPARLTVLGADKQKVGALAAEIRALRKAEPYKGKGVRYAGERVRRKQGKSFTGGAG
jgi:large subunit ribosomal protein L6